MIIELEGLLRFIGREEKARSLRLGGLVSTNIQKAIRMQIITPFSGRRLTAKCLSTEIFVSSFIFIQLIGH